LIFIAGANGSGKITPTELFKEVPLLDPDAVANRSHGLYLEPKPTLDHVRDVILQARHPDIMCR
jgi:hypothetical protein